MKSCYQNHSDHAESNVVDCPDIFNQSGTFNILTSHTRVLQISWDHPRHQFLMFLDLSFCELEYISSERPDII